jgi:hypothetical protein
MTSKSQASSSSKQLSDENSERAHISSSPIDLFLSTTQDHFGRIFKSQNIPSEHREFQKKVDELYNLVLVDAREVEIEEEVKPLLKSLIEAFEQYAALSQYTAIELHNIAKRNNGNNPCLAVIGFIEKSLRELGRLAPQMRRLEPLTNLKSAIWNALDGQMMDTEQLCKHLKRPDLSPDYVRQVIKQMRANGHSIGHCRGGGYFRPDARPNP